MYSIWSGTNTGVPHPDFYSSAGEQNKCLVMLKTEPTYISCIWLRSLAGSSPQNRCTLESGGRAPYLTGANPEVPQVCH